jgi:hypothetical protein
MLMDNRYCRAVASGPLPKAGSSLLRSITHGNAMADSQCRTACQVATSWSTPGATNVDVHDRCDGDITGGGEQILDAPNAAKHRGLADHDMRRAVEPLLDQRLAHRRRALLGTDDGHAGTDLFDGGFEADMPPGGQPIGGCLPGTR